MRTFIIGAGASKAYSESPTNCRMPIANDFFQTFNKLNISNDLRVHVGDIINICKEDFKIDVMDFYNLSFNIEEFHSYIEQKLIIQMQEGNIFNNIYYYKAYKQLIFLFTSVINEIQNGTISEVHKNLIFSLNEDDSIITFNWDTLIDRALNEYTDWKTDFGYCIKPEKIYKNKWIKPDVENIKFNKLIKLHGSTNWITTYPIPDKNQIFKLNQTIDKSAFYVYENTKEPYSCYDGRYEGPYEAFSYFYYPPNILDDIGLDELKDKVWIKPGVLGSKETKQMYEKMFNCTKYVDALKNDFHLLYSKTKVPYFYYKNYNAWNKNLNILFNYIYIINDVNNENVLDYIIQYKSVIKELPFCSRDKILIILNDCKQ